MRRYPVLLAILMVLLLGAVPKIKALTDEEKKEEFLQARGQGEDSPSPSVTPHHHHHAGAEVTPHRHHTPAPDEESSEADVTPHHHHKSPTADHAETPRHRHHEMGTGEGASPEQKHHEQAEGEETPRLRHSETEAHAEETPEHQHHRLQEPVTPAPTATPALEQRPARTPPPQVVQPYRPGYQPYAQPYTQQNNQPYAAPAETPAPYPRAVPAPTPAPGPGGAMIDVEKEGLEQQGGFEPPPPPSAHHHWWQFFGGGNEDEEYPMLTRAVRDAIDRAPVARRRWRYIVVHNSGTRQGNAKIFDYYHRYVRKMKNGLAYHFVIGNGTSSGDGQIEIGGRWTKQLQGGHVHSDFLNNISLGICLVGDFNRDLPTKRQLEALDELIRYLRIRVGKIDGRVAIVKAHREINPPQWPTDCPGDRFPYYWLHSRFD